MIKDDYLDDFYTSIERIFSKEVGFAVHGIIKRVKKNAIKQFISRYQIAPRN